MKSLFHRLLILSLMTAQPVLAGTLIEMRDSGGETTRVLIEKNNVRINMLTEDGFMLINLDSKKMYSVSVRDHIIMEMEQPSRNMAHGVKSEKAKLPKIEFVKKGKGPALAGFDTEHYQVNVGGKYCQDEYLSKKLLSNDNIKNYFDAMITMSPNIEETGAGHDDDPCAILDWVISDEYKKLGVPLRTVAEDGTMLDEITKIEQSTSFAGDTFILPADYQRLTMQDMMKMMKDSPAMPSDQ